MINGLRDEVRNSVLPFKYQKSTLKAALRSIFRRMCNLFVSLRFFVHIRGLVQKTKENWFRRGAPKKMLYFIAKIFVIKDLKFYI